MPETLRGIGTSFYGARDFRADGSLVTTEWFVFVYVPLLPLRSLRIRCSGDNVNRLIYGACKYQMLEPAGLNWTQVLSVWAWWAVVLPSLAALFHEKRWWYALPLALAFFAPGFLRKRALEELKQKEERAQMGLEPR